MKASEYFDKAAVELSFKDPILLHVATIIGRKETNTITSLGVDTRSNHVILEYNPNWVTQLSYETFLSCYSLELIRLLLKHPTSRLYDPKEISWIASNIAICELNIPDNLKQLISNQYSASTFGYKPGLSYEAYWKLLLEDQPSDGEGDNTDEDNSDGSESSDSGSQSNDGGNDQDQSEGDSQTFNQAMETEALKQHFTKENDSNKNWSENQSIDEDIQTVVEDAKTSAKMWGSYSGNISENIIAAYTKTFDPRSILRQFNNSVKSTEIKGSRMKLNRRYGLIYPGKKHDMKSYVLIAIDISGSMSTDDITEGLTLVNDFISGCSIDYLLFDTQIKGFIPNVKKKQTEIDIKGRGGTDIRCVFEHLEKHKGKYQGCITYSDGYYSPVDKRISGIKFLWITSAGGTLSPQTYGSKLMIDDIRK